MKKLVLVMLVLGLVLPALADLIVANDDITVRVTRSNVYNNSNPFGLMAKGSDYFLAEFTLGSDAVTSATLQLDNQYLAGAEYSIGFKASEYDFDDNTLTYAATPDTSGWTAISGSMDGVLGIGVYSVDITSWYNANLGKTMTLQGYQVSGSGDAPIFDDLEGTLGGTAPAIVTVPEPTTLLLLSAGFGALIRRKR